MTMETSGGYGTPFSVVLLILSMVIIVISFVLFDIVTTTPYTKFLCSFANILEVFFLVMFFDALLSVKAMRKESA